MTKEDLALLDAGRRPASPLNKLRESHHMVARLAALGLRPGQIALQTGYSVNRISILLHSPAMKELISGYAKTVDEAFTASIDTYFDLATRNMVRAERMLADRLDEADDGEIEVATKDLLAISRDAADRFGYGKKQTVNHNVDWAEALDRAVKRSGKVIDVTPEPQKVLPFVRRA